MKKYLVICLLVSACGQGPAGTNGVNGSSCSVSQLTPSTAAPEGGALISCTDGTSSLVLSGTVIKSVQFCPGTPSYPAVFPEVGFMIGGKLYAVYSQNGGFLALITPGTYYSNGINNSCTFTVNADYSITR